MRIYSRTVLAGMHDDDQLLMTDDWLEPSKGTVAPLRPLNQRTSNIATTLKNPEPYAANLL